MERYLVWIIKLSISGLLITPLLVSPQTLFPFTVGKSLWFRSLIIISTTAFSILIFKYKYEKPKIPGIVLILLVFLFVNLISAILGYSFTKSFWGTWDRMEGIITILFIILMIFVTSNIFQRIEDWKKLFQLNLAIGFIVAFLALSQLAGLPFRFLDFLPITTMYMPLNESYPGFSDTNLDSRINGTLPNPSFLAQYLSIIVFIGFGFLFEKSIHLIKKLNRSNISFNKIKNELLLFFLLLFGITVCLFTIILTGSRSAFLGLFLAILITTPLIILKINKKSIRYSFLSIIFSTLLIVIISPFYLNLIIEWSSDKYRNKIIEQNLPESILQRITNENVDQSFFSPDKFRYYMQIYLPREFERNEVNEKLFKQQIIQNQQQDFRDDSSYKPILKNTIDQLMIKVDKKQDLECDEEILLLNELMIWYYPNEYFLGPNGFTSINYLNLKVLYYELPSGTKVHLYDHGPGPGKTFIQCSPVYKTLYKINPSIAYIFNAGIDLGHRKTIYRISLDAFKKKPFLGYGAENFYSIYYKYSKGTDFDGYHPSKWDRSHSRPLDILTSTGIFGFTIWMIIWIWVAIIIFRNLKQNNESNFSLFVGGALLAFFGSNLVLFPTITTYIQSSLLISFLARSQLGFDKTDNKPKIIQVNSKPNYSIKKIQQNIIILLIIVVSLISFYWLIVIPYSSAKNQSPRKINTDLENFSEELSKFPQMAIQGRTELIYLILGDWNSIVNSDSSKEQVILKIISVIENNAEDSLKREPNHFELNLGMWNFYIRLSQYNELFLTKAQEKAEILIEIGPTSLSAQEAMIRTALFRSDLDSAKKWVEIWKTDHPRLEKYDREIWDDKIKILENTLD